MHFCTVGKVIRKTVASFLAGLMIGMPAMANIAGPGVDVTHPNGDTTNINGGLVNGNNTLNNFTDFTINGGHTVNQYFNTANAINMVNARININGMYNSFMNGASGGNVIFISPLGMAVGAGGVLNVGSLQTIVPTQGSYNNMVDAYTTMRGLYASAAPDSNGNINVADADMINFNAYYAAVQNPANIGNADVRVDGRIVASGLVSIAADSIHLGTGAGADTNNISTLGAVSLIANTGDIVGGDNLVIDAGGNIVLESKGGNVGSSDKVVKMNSGGEITATANNGGVHLSSVGKDAIYNNITAKNDVTLKTENSGKLTTKGTVSGNNITLVSAADAQTGIINATNGNISITTESGMKQTDGTSITSSNGTTTIVNNTSNDIVLSKVTAKGLTINNKAGNVLVKTGSSPALTSTDTTSITAKNDIDQEGTGVALSSSKAVTLTATNGQIGSTAFKLNSDGAVSAQANTGIKLKSPDKALTIANAKTNTGNVDISTDTGNLTVTDTVSTGNGSVTLDSAGSANVKNITASSGITVNSKAGMSQTAGGFINNTGTGTVNISNTANGNVNLVKVANQAGDINVTNSAANGNIILASSSVPVLKTSNGNVNVTANKNITQTGNEITIDSSGNIVLTAGTDIGDAQAVLLKAANTVSGTTTAGNINLGSKSGNTTKLGTMTTGGTFKFVGGSVELANNLSAKSVTLSNLDSLKTLGFSIASTGGAITLDTITNATLDNVNANGALDIKNISGILAANGDLGGTSVSISNIGTLNQAAGKNIASSGGNVNLDTISSATLNNITATGGNITINKLTTGSLNNVTADGNVSITNGTGTLTANGDIQGQNVAISNLGTFNQASGKKINATAGNVNIDTLTNATLGDVKATNNVTINKISNALNANGDIQGKSVTITNSGTLTQAVGKNISATAGSVILDTLAAAVLNDITATGGNVSIKNITNKLTSNGNISGATVTLANLGSFEQAINKNITATGGDVSLDTIGNAILRDVTASGNVAINKVTALTSNGTIQGQNVTLSNLGTASLQVVKALASDGKVSVSSTGAITLNDLIKGKTVTFDTGDIISNGANALINADTIDLTSTGSIGTNSNGLKLTSDSASMNVKAKAGTNAYLSSNKNITFDGVNASNIVNLKTTNGANLTTIGTTSGAVITLDSAGNAQIGAVQSTDTLDVKAVTGITQAAGTKISSANKTTIKNAANATDNDINLHNVEAGSIEIENLSGNVVLDTASNTALTSRGTTSVTGKNLIQKGQGKAISSVGAMTLTASAGSIKNQAATSTPDKNATFKVSGGAVSASATGDVFLSAALNGSNYANDLTVTNVSGQTVYLGANNLTLNAMTADKASLNADNALTINTNLTTKNGLNIDTNTLNLNSHSITNNTSGDVNIYAKSASNLYAVSNTNGNINIGNGSGSYTLNDVVNGKNVNVNTTGALLSALAGEIIASNNIVLTAGSIGTTAKSVDVTAGTGATVTATTTTGMNLNSKAANTTFGALKNTGASGNINVTTDGNATFSTVTNKNGDVTIGKDDATGSFALNGLVDAKNVTVATKGSISTTLDSAAINATGNVILKALQGTIGASKALNITAGGNVSAEALSGIDLKSGSSLNILKAQTGTGDLNINTTSGNITLVSGANVASGSGDVTIDAAGNLILGGTIAGNTVDLTGANITSPDAVINATTVNLTADTGAIGNNTTALNIATTGNVTAKAKTGINILNKNKNLNIADAVSDTGNVKLATATSGKIAVLNAKAKAGSVIINSAADAEVTNLSATSGIDIDTKTGFTQASGGSIASTGGEITIDNATSGNITLKNVTNNGNIKITNASANGDVVFDTNASTPVVKTQTNGDVTIKSGRDVLQNGTGVAIDSVKKITFDAKGDVKNSAAGSTFKLDSGDIVSVTNAKNVSLSAATGSLKLGKVNITDEFAYTGSDLTLTDDLSAGSIHIYDINNLDQQSGTITAKTGNALFENIVNATLNNVSAANGTIQIDTITNLITNGTISGKNIIFDNITSGTLNNTITAIEDVTFNNTSGAQSNIVAKAQISGKNVTIDGVTTADLNKVTATQNIKIKTTGAVKLNDLIKASDVAFDTGDIIANHANALINANTVDLKSSGSIGTNTNGIKITSTGASVNVKANAANDVYLSSDKNTTFDNVQGGAVVNLKTTANNAKLTTTGTTKGASVTLDSKGALEAGDIQTTSGDVSITATGAVSQTAGKLIDSKGKTTIKSANDKVALENINSVGDLEISAKTGISQGAGTVITSNGNALVTNVAGGSGNIVLDKFNADNVTINNNTGDVILNDLLSATGNATITGGNITSDAINAIKANNLTLTARNAIGTKTQALNISATGDVTALSATGINLNSTGANLNIASAKTTGAGDIIISSSAANGNIIINEIDAANGDIDIHNASGGGLITINDDALTVKVGKKATITAYDGANSGIVFTALSNATNNGTLTIVNSGTQGTNFSGTLTNNGTLSATNNAGAMNIQGTFTNAQDKTSEFTNKGTKLTLNATVNNNGGTIKLNNEGTGGTLINGTVNNNKTNNKKGTITVNNSKGDLTVAKTAQINNSGEIFLNNLENSGKLDILSNAIKNLASDSKFVAVNNGSGGLNFDKDAVIENYGTLELTNNKGSFLMDGTINMHSGSNNTFTDSTDNDFVIKSNIDNDGNNITFAQTGGGNLILAEGTNITNKNSGTINLKNTTGGGIELKENSIIKNNTNSTLNITNESATGGIKIDGQITADAGSKNNKVNITNKGTDIVVNDKTSISHISDLTITNTKESTGNLNIFGALEDNGNITLQNLNYGNTQINIGNKKIHTNGLLSMKNNGQNGLTVDGKQISSNGGIRLESINSITVNGKLVNDESAKADTKTHKGIVIINNFEEGHTTNNTGITINGVLSSNAKNNQIINNNTHADSGIFINDTIDGSPAITTNGGIEIISKGGKGVVLDGKILNSLNGITKNLGGDIKITSEKTGIDIIHYDTNTYDTDVRIKNEIGGISITAKEIKNSTGKTGVGLIASGDISLNATGGSVGEYDNAMDTVKNDGYVNPDGSSRLDDSISVNVLAGGKTSASSFNGGNGVVNIRSYGLDNALNTTKDMNIGKINTDGIAILPSIGGSLFADTIIAKNAHLYAGKLGDGTINVNNAVISGLLSGESDGNINISSKNANQKMDVDYLFSKNGNISLDINGNSNIASITAPGTITVVSHGNKLHFDSLGKFDVERAKDIIPSVLNLTVTDRVSGRMNGLIDIFHAYVRDKVIMRADNIHAQETIDKVTGVSDGHGFHTANKNGKYVSFDIQGYNHQQYPILSPITDFGNPNYKPDPSDRRVLDLKLTIGEPVEGLFGAQFDRVYSDNAHINAGNVIDPMTNEKMAANFNFDNITINLKGRLQNNRYTVDVNNVDKNYDYNADATLYTKITGSFRTAMSENLTIDTTAPIVVYNPNRIFNLPHTENSFQRLTNKSNSVEKETAMDRWHDKKKNTRSATDRKDIRWSIANNDQKIIGSSSSESDTAITDILDISKGGMLVATNNRLNKGELLNVNFIYKGIPFDVQGEVVRVDGDKTAGVKFINVDRFTSNIILYMTMMTESL